MYVYRSDRNSYMYASYLILFLGSDRNTCMYVRKPTYMCVSASTLSLTQRRTVVMSHTWMIHITHMNESCHTWTSHVCICKYPLDVVKWDMSRVFGKQSIFTYTNHLNESCHTHEWVTSHTLETQRRAMVMWHTCTIHTTHTNESCHTCMSNVTHMKESCHTHAVICSCTCEMKEESCHKYDYVMSHPQTHQAMRGGGVTS